jgi:hypothetical protein
MRTMMSALKSIGDIAAWQAKRAMRAQPVNGEG